MVRMVDVDRVMLERDFVVEHKKSTDHKMELPHFHDGLEIHFTLNDETLYYVDERRYEGDAGAVAVFNSQEIHRVVVQENIPYERYYILFKPRYLDFVTAEYPDLLRCFTHPKGGAESVVQLSAEPQAELKRLFDQLLYVTGSREITMRELHVKQKLLEIVLFLADRFSVRGGFAAQLDYVRNSETILVANYMRENYYEPISLAEICSRFFISKSTLNRMFRHNLGTTPIEYLSYIRIMESRKFLCSGYPVGVVAEKVGFNDGSTFINNFKKIQGISPKQYALREQAAHRIVGDI